MHREQNSAEIKKSYAKYDLLPSIDFVLQNNGTPSKLSVPLTVVIKLEAGSHLKSAQGAGNRALKAWSCALDELCVNVDSYDENIHVQ